MDIISYGVANKAGKSEQHTRNDVLGQGVEGSFLHTKDRINKLEEGIQNVVSQADKLIVHDTINIMKAHAQLNAIAKTTRYNMHNMIFDDLLDLSGIDTTKSSGYIHDTDNGMIIADSNNTVIVTKEIQLTPYTNKLIIISESSYTAGYVSAIPRMTSLSSTEGSIIGNFGNGGYTPVNVFDGNLNTRGSTVFNSGWIGFAFTNPKIIKRYTMTSWNKTDAPKNWTFQGYKDGVWTTLHTISNYTSWGTTVTRTFDVIDNNGKLNDIEYDQYRVNCTETNGGWFSLNELSMYMSVEEPSIQLSFDDGKNWKEAKQNTVYYLKEEEIKSTSKIILKILLSNTTKLLNYALTWA